jgi:hypothetical protein
MRFNVTFSHPKPLFGAMGDRPVTKGFISRIPAFGAGLLHESTDLGGEVDAGKELTFRRDDVNPVV